MFCRWVGFVLSSALLSPIAWCKVPREGARVTISVYNDAGVPENVLSQGEEEASLIFREAGIVVKWLNCKVPAATEEDSRMCREAIFPEHLHLRIVREARNLKAETMGISFLDADGIGCYADLFYKPMEERHKNNGTNLARLLGRVAAHEVGHLLLGTNSHAVAGIMHAQWTASESASGKGERLVFLDKESLKMKDRLLAARKLSKEGSATVAARIGD